MEQKQTGVEWLISQLQKSKDWHRVLSEVSQMSSAKVDILEQAKEMEKEQKMQLPSDEEIKEYVKSTGYYGHCTYEYHEGIEEGAKWMRDKIQGGNK